MEFPSFQSIMLNTCIPAGNISFGNIIQKNYAGYKSGLENNLIDKLEV
jgi:hypothetical protein